MESQHRGRGMGMATIKVQLRILWSPPRDDAFPAGAVIRIWTNGDGTGKAQEFDVGRDATINGQLVVPEKLDLKEGQVLCWIRAFDNEAEIAATRQPILWRGGVASDPVHVGNIVWGNVSQKGASGRGPASAQFRVEVFRSGSLGSPDSAEGQSEIVGEDGSYWVSYPSLSDEKASAEIELRYGYDRARGTSLASLVISDPSVETVADLLVESGGATFPPKPDDSPDKAPFVVRGGLAYVSREGLGGTLEIRLLQERLSGQYLIHSELVKTAERYEIAFAGPVQNGAVTVEAHLPTAEGRRTTLLSISRSVEHLTNPLELDLLVGDPLGTLPLFERTMAAIEPYTDRLALAALDTTQWAKLAKAAGLSDLDQNRIRQASGLTREIADHLGPEAARFLPALFVLTPSAVARTLADLIAENDELQLARMTKAQEAGDIGPEPWRFTDANIEYSVAMAEFLSLKKEIEDKVLFDPSVKSAQVKAQLAAISVVGSNQRRHVMALAEDAADLPGRFETVVQNSKLLTAAEKARVLLVSATAAMVEMHPPLVDALATPTAKYPLTHPAEIAAYRPDELATIIRGAGEVPALYQQYPDPGRAFADAILSNCSAQYPTRAFLARLNTEPALSKPTRQAAEALAANPAFDLFAVPVAHHFEKQAPVSEKASPESGRSSDRVVLPADQYDGLRMLQRLARLAPRTSAVTATVVLTDMGIASAHDIVATGRGRFLQIASQQMDTQTANSVYASAVWVDQITTLATLVAHQQDSAYSLSPPNPFSFKADSTPALADLFGSFDTCACEHCRSVYSPAAYLTDLLHWLGQEFGTKSEPALGYDKLIKRRADIAQIELNCENTDTLLPHIDLVLETLEYAVGQDKLDLSDVHNQTEWPTVDLLRDGEHFGSTEKPAYGPQHLFSAVYPWTLPFNLSLEQSRAYLKAIGVDRSDLISLANGKRPWDPDKKIAAETLGMNAKQFEVIAGQAIPPAPFAFWNNTDSGTEKVAKILELSGLSQDALLDVLRAEYVRHAGGPPVIFSIVFDSGKPCDLSSAIVDPPLKEPYADRIHRMTRLKRTLGWTFWELDEAIIAIGDAADMDPLNQTFLIRLGHFELLRRRTKLPVRELLAWFGNLPAYRGQEPSEFYKDAFLNKVGPGQQADLFQLAVAVDLPNRALATARSLEPGQQNTLSDYERAQLRETLGYEQGDFTRATAEFQVTELDLANLTLLFRLRSVAQAARLSIDELIDLTTISPATPVSWTPAEALRFFDLLDWLTAQDLTASALIYLLTGDGEGDGLALPPNDLDRLKVRLYGAGGDFHALLSAPPTVAMGQENDIGHVEQLFARALGLIQSVPSRSTLEAVVRGVIDPQPNADAFFDSVLPGWSTGPSLGANIAAAVSHPSYPRISPLADPADPELKSEIEIKAAIVRYFAPSMLRSDLWDVTLAAYSDFTQLPPDKAAFLLKFVETDFSSTNALMDALTPSVDLNYHPTTPIAPPTDFDDLVRQLHLAAARVRRLELVEATLDDLHTYFNDRNPGVAAGATDVSWFDPFWVGTATTSRSVAASQWRNLTEGLGLRKDLGISLTSLIEQLHSGIPNPIGQALTSMLAAESLSSRYSSDQVKATLEHLKELGADDSVAPLIASAAQILSDLDRWGITLDQALRFAADPSPGDVPSQPDEIRLSMRNRFTDEAKWDNAIRAAHDPLREIRRDRLADYLIAKYHMKSAEDLYAHFLIDVEMSSCMETSRLVLATNAVQLFIQRIFLGLEPDIPFADTQKEEWKWRKNYRVWEAARKVFLYPENWLVESLRLDKTPFFESLEEELMQGELSDERIENAYVEYLKKVAEVSRLEIAGLCYDADTARSGRPYGELHVFGRTRAEPHRYFHRLQKTNGAWSPWAPVEQEIEGDHLIPVIWNRRVHVLWPTFIERRNGAEDYYELHFSDISLQSGKWSPKRKLPGTVLSGKYSGVGVFDNLDRKTGAVGSVSTVAALTLFGAITYDFALASLKRSKYFFRAYTDGATVADLRVNVRRGFDDSWGLSHRSYLEAAYEDGVRYSGGDPGATLEPPYPQHSLFDPTWFGKYWNCRPHYTLPNAMKLRSGFDRIDEAAQAQPAPHKLYSKTTFIHWEQTPRILLDSTASDYQLVFAQQNEHHLFPAPFFFEDDAHTYFAERSLVSLTASTRSSVALGQAVAAKSEAYKFTNFTVPGVSLYLAELNANGIDALLAPKEAAASEPNYGLRRQQRVFDDQFAARYQPSGYVDPDYPVEEMDFTHGSPTAPYFWEIYFHIPMLIAERLRADGKFEQALKWVGYIFDPTNQDDSADARRFWMLKPFYDYQAFGQIDTQMLLLSTALTPQERARRDALIRQIQAWEQDPFDPHSVATMRTLGYMLWTFMTYVGILIDWGDSLFRQDTRESINEATQLYVFAGNLLGRRPEEVAKPDAAPKTYAEIRAQLDAFSNIAVEVENNLTVYDIVPGAGAQSGAIGTSGALALYFCIPHNPQLLELWDTVGDRLFKIRHCMNIEGTVRDLALFSPPIDPGLLVRARAAGLDISEVLSDLAAPRAPYRFTYLLQKANEFAAEVKAFGGALLAAAEKRDSEQMAQLRGQHEIDLQKAMRNVRQRQIDEAKAQIEALTQTRKMTEVRKAAYEARKFFLPAEIAQMAQLVQSLGLSTGQAIGSGIASILHLLDMNISVPSPSKNIRLGNVAQSLATVSGALAGVASTASSLSGQVAGAQRRKEEWDLQIALATEELKQIDKQIVGAEIRAAIAEQELANLDLQTEQSKEVLDFMKAKFSNQALYSWMATRLSSLHYQAYKLAYDLAKKAQAAYALELGRPDDSFVTFGNWDGQKQGLLAGESLGLQLRQLEAAYIEHNTREYELRRSVSLRLLDPVALATLIQTGACEFELPEWLFDLDLPGLYMRRIKTLALTLPCVTGPYIPVHAKLTLLRHEIRWKPNDDPTDVRFDAIQSIITSSGLNDGGLFETSMQDPRYLPFEGCGVVARFRLELPGEAQFDPTTLSDAILALSYTAREGGDLLRADVIRNLPAQTAPPLMMSLRHDFPDEWRAFLADGAAAVAANMLPPPPPPAVPPLPIAAVPIVIPSIGLDRQPYRARSATGTYAASQAWALTSDADGLFELVGVALADVPVTEASASPTVPMMYFGAAGLQWTDGAGELRRVTDVLIVYEKS